jgi:FAD/FMN-containing dehydrogenase
LDNLLGAEVVLADGRLVCCDERENPELFWALRGGGGNFGVVTAMRVRLHPVRGALAGMILFPFSQAESVLRGYAEVSASAPDELSVLAVMLSASDGSPVVGLAPMWTGENRQGEEWISRLNRLGTPIMEQVSPTTYASWLAMWDSHTVLGRHCAAESRWLPALTLKTIAPLVAGLQQKTSTFSAIILHHFRGAATRVPLAATAFGLREEHFMLEIIAMWEPSAEDEGTMHRNWAHSVWNDLASYALPGGYPNMLAPHQQEQTVQAYGSNLGRLQRAKRLFDPEAIFTSAISLPDIPRAA